MSFRSEMKNGVSTLVPFMDATKLQPLLDQIAPDVADRSRRTPPCASDGTKAWVVAGKNGEQLDADATAQAITAATLEPTDRTVNVVIKDLGAGRSPPTRPRPGASQDLLSSYTTTYSCPKPRQTNVKLCTKYATDVLLAPGQEYNFDKQIGPRTVARGWQLAPGIIGPNQLEDVLGGGICQVSTTMFNAVAGVTRASRSPSATTTRSTSTTIPKAGTRRSPAGARTSALSTTPTITSGSRGSSTGVTTTIYRLGTDRRPQDVSLERRRLLQRASP